MVQIIHAHDESHIQHIIQLSGEYVTWMVETLTVTYPEIDTSPFLESHSYEDVRKRFPGKYVPPLGRLFLATQDQDVCGCVALAPWTDPICEIQTLFVRPAYRGQGIGKILVNHVIDTAREIGYQQMRLDTLAFMTGAQQLYESLGFDAIEAYRSESGPIQKHLRYYALNLDQQPINQ